MIYALAARYKGGPDALEAKLDDALTVKAPTGRPRALTVTTAEQMARDAAAFDAEIAKG